MQPLHRFFTPTTSGGRRTASRRQAQSRRLTSNPSGRSQSRYTRTYLLSPRLGYSRERSRTHPAACIASAMRWTSSGRPSRRTLTMTTSLENLRRPSRRSLRLRLQKSPKKSSLCSSVVPSRGRIRTRYIVARPLENIFSPTSAATAGGGIAAASGHGHSRRRCS